MPLASGEAVGKVVVTNGCKHAVYNTFQVLCDPGDEVLLPAPYWTSYPECITLGGGVPVPLPTTEATGFRVSVAQLDAAVTPRTKALLFVSPSNMERYLDAARKISRLAIGDPAMPVLVNIHKLDAEHPQDERVDDLPFGTRGGLAVRSEFPVDGTYVVKVELAAAPRERHDLEITVDGARAALRTLGDKRIKFVGIDDDPIVLEAIKDGFVAGTMAQNPYGQGYIGAYVLDLLAGGGCTVKDDAKWIETPQTKRFIDSGTMVINADNLTSYKDDLKKITTEIQASFKDKYLNCQ